MIKELELEGADLKAEDVTLKWTAVTTQQSINHRNPQRGIVRHQFMEIIARLIEQK
jgi:hypothetical protein